ncbi:phosphatidylinositol N-acetylglucosaminyltransferase subunit Q-like [Malaya genurostris]|uniref:phosphatidylinositol N-acetylglucosaminyltransferase subunit Q-like n=1 Tax=Malaya genurostris TaxID=325434 RepID=UPI0026F3B828|nr:phosphatidylinositol N-acetylglucosaminyltransferase subunit Q-like [Malaya genurostris]
MEYAELVVNYLRNLLTTLRGSPIGLKLNAPLNNFFLSCFLYHVDLWWTFLIIVSPAIRFLFLPLSVLGLLGLSFQLAMFSDLIILISLHAHCFYIYAAVLYRIELGGIRALCRIVLGKKKNILRDRVESHEYMRRQLFIATMTFAVLLFLLPTILVYYAVFATLRFSIYCISYVLMTVRRTILQFPFDAMIRWLRGTYTDVESLEIYNIGSYANENITIIYIAPKPSRGFWNDQSWQRLRWSAKTGNDNPSMGATISIGRFFVSLVQGEMVAFIQPDENHYHSDKKIE